MKDFEVKKMKAYIEVIKFDVKDVVTASGEIATCTIPNQPVEECDFE